jgi:hypothetical protein
MWRTRLGIQPVDREPDWADTLKHLADPAAETAIVRAPDSDPGGELVRIVGHLERALADARSVVELQTIHAELGRYLDRARHTLSVHEQVPDNTVRAISAALTSLVETVGRWIDRREGER